LAEPYLFPVEKDAYLQQQALIRLPEERIREFERKKVEAEQEGEKIRQT